MSLENIPGISIQNQEIIHKGPLVTAQNWKDYTPEAHKLWQFLYEKQLQNLQGIAYSPWLDALGTIGINRQEIPKLTDIAALMYPLTQWIPVPISGFLKASEYFHYVAKRQFPTVVRLRPKEVWEFQVEPDLFHDAFGHLPMHVDRVFADFLQLFGQMALRANEHQVTELSRLYWFTVEYGLIHENGEIKVCGSGHLSGFKEARYSLSDAVKKHPFDLETVIHQEFNPHVLQEQLFVMDSFSQVFEALKRYEKKLK